MTQQVRNIQDLAGGRRVAVFASKRGGSIAMGIEGLGIPVFTDLEDLLSWIGGASGNRHLCPPRRNHF
jgi:hypothetical protein